MDDLGSRLGLPATPQVVAIGAHADDVEIGATGLLLRILNARPNAATTLVVLASTPIRAEEARESFAALVPSSAVLVLDGTDGYLPYEDPAGMKRRLSESLPSSPDLVLVHRRDDLHQDHRFACELAWQLFRTSTILEYEIPKWDGDLGTANLYVPVTRTVADRKITNIMKSFRSQAHHDWFTADTFEALLRLRGIECRSPSGLAEAFVARKLVLS